MAKVDSMDAGGANPATDPLSIDSALAEWVYHRAITDQGLSLAEISPALSITKLDSNSLVQNGFVPGIDGFIYNVADGFTAAVVQDLNTLDYTIVYRGTDVADLGVVNGAAAVLVGASSAAVDGLDVQQDVLLGQGTFAPVNQANDAINLASAVLALAGGATGKVHVVGQSLGGGLAGLAAAALGVSATLIAPAPFLNELSPLALQKALHDANITDINPANYYPSAARGSTIGPVTTVGDIVFVERGAVAYNVFKQNYDAIVARYMSNVASSGVSVYRNDGEILTNPHDAVGWGISLGSQQFKAANQTYEFGSVPNTDSSGSLHAAALHALEMRSVSDPSSPGDFSVLSRNDGILRDALIGNTEGVIGPLGQARSDDPNVPTTSRVGAYGPDPGIVERALWKTVGDDNGLYAYAWKAFAPQSGILESGAAGNGAGSDVDPTKPTIHSGIVRLALSVLRSAVYSTSTIDEVNAKPSHNFAGGTDGQPLSDKAIVHLSDVQAKGAGENDANGLPFGENDLDHVVWNNLTGAAGSDAAVAATVHVTADDVFGTGVGSQTSAAEGLGWKVAVVQAGEDKGNLHYDASDPSTDAKNGDDAVGNLIVGGGGTDQIVASKQRDYVLDEGGNGTIVTGSGNDVIYADGSYIVNGGSGDDAEFETSTSSDTFILSAGNDTIINGSKTSRLGFLTSRIDGTDASKDPQSATSDIRILKGGSYVGGDQPEYVDFNNNGTAIWPFTYEVDYIKQGSNLVLKYKSETGNGDGNGQEIWSGTTTIRNFSDGDFGLTFDGTPGPSNDTTLSEQAAIGAADAGSPKDDATTDDWSATGTSGGGGPGGGGPGGGGSGGDPSGGFKSTVVSPNGTWTTYFYNSDRTLTRMDVNAVSGDAIDISGTGDNIAIDAGTINVATSTSANVSASGTTILLASSDTVALASGLDNTINVDGKSDSIEADRTTVALWDDASAGLAGTGNDVTLYDRAALVAQDVGNNAVFAGSGASLTMSGGNVAVWNGAGGVLLGSQNTVTTYDNATLSITGVGNSLSVSGVGDTIAVAGGNVSFFDGSAATITGDGNTTTLYNNVSANIGGAGNSVNVSGSGDALAIDNGLISFWNGAGGTLSGSGNNITLYNANTTAVVGAANRVTVNGTGDALSADGAEVAVWDGSSATITGSNNTVELDGDSSVAVAGTGTRYALADGSGTMTIQAAAGTNTGTVDYGPSNSPESLWFDQVGDDLEVTTVGANTKVRVSDWFGGNAAPAVQGFVADGFRIDSSVANLVSAMASFEGSHPGFDPTTASQMPTDSTLQSAIAAAWHHA